MFDQAPPFREKTNNFGPEDTFGQSWNCSSRIVFLSRRMGVVRIEKVGFVWQRNDVARVNEAAGTGDGWGPPTDVPLCPFKTTKTQPQPQPPSYTQTNNAKYYIYIWSSWSPNSTYLHLDFYYLLSWRWWPLWGGHMVREGGSTDKKFSNGGKWLFWKSSCRS